MFVSVHSLLISLRAVPLFPNQTTHTPFRGVPGHEPTSEGGRFKSLFDQDDGGVWVSAARVSAQVLSACDHRFFALYLVGFFTDPENHLRPTMRTRRMRFSFSDLFVVICVSIHYKHLIPGPMCPAAWHHPHWGRPAWTESPQWRWNGPSYWSIQTGAAGGLGPSAVTCSQQVCLTLWHSWSSFLNISIILVSLSPLVIGIRSLSTQQIPEFKGLLPLRHYLLTAFLADHRADLLCHGSLISARSLVTKYLDHYELYCHRTSGYGLQLTQVTVTNTWKSTEARTTLLILGLGKRC